MHAGPHGLEFLFALPALLPCCFFPCVGVFGLLTFIFWVWTLVDLVTKEPSEGNDKIVWLLVVLLTGLIGALIYVLIRRPERKRKYGR